MISEYMKCELFGVCGFGYIGCFGGSPDGLGLLEERGRE